jgi:AraC-like DNA-binding protein
MSKNPDLASPPVVGLSEVLEAGVGPLHRHGRAQLIYSADGVLVVTTERGTYVVPPQRAVWVAGGERHRVEARRRVGLKTLYFDTTRVPNLPQATTVLQVSDLLRELVVTAVSIAWTWDSPSSEARLFRVLRDQLRLTAAAIAPLQLARGRDPRVLRACAAVERDPGRSLSLPELARIAKAGDRQLARLFVAETGVTPAAWREQLRLLLALELLGSGEPITAVALELGYSSASSFGVMFKRALGTSPGRYFNAARQAAGSSARAMP